MLTRKQTEAAKFVGRAIAHDTIREGYDRQWTGLEVEDADKLMAAALAPRTPEWDEAVAVAREAYEAELAK